MESQIIKHFCVTMYVFNESGKKILLHKHKKLGFYVPPGGHIEENEDFNEALFREMYEEIGLKKESVVIPEYLCPIVDGLIQPLVIYSISPGENHFHYDFIYPVLISENTVIRPQEGESKDFKWFESESVNLDITSGKCVEWIKKISKMIINNKKDF